MWYVSWPLWACSMHHALPVNLSCFLPLITTHTSPTATTDCTANKGGLWCDRKWKLLCSFLVGKWAWGRRGRCRRLAVHFYTGSNDAAFRWLSLLCGIVWGSFQETAPRKTTENTVKHRSGAVGCMVAIWHATIRYIYMHSKTDGKASLI